MNTEYTMQTLPVRYWVIIGLLFFIAFMKNGRQMNDYTTNTSIIDSVGGIPIQADLDVQLDKNIFLALGMMILSIFIIALIVKKVK